MTAGVVVRQQRLGRSLFPLGLAFLAVGTATAVVLPFLSLFLSTAVHADPVRVTLFLVVAPVAGVTVGTAVGRLSDRVDRRRLLVGAAVAGLVSMGLTSFVRDYWVLLGLTATLTATAGSLFPQTFAYAREVLARNGSARAAMGISTLRTVFSLAWVGGPVLAATLLRIGGFTYVYAVAAVMYAVAALVAVFWLDDTATRTARLSPDPPDTIAPAARHSTVWLTVIAFTLLQCPLTLTTQALPMFASINLHGEINDAGLVLGLCAALEIPLMLGLGALTTRFRLRPLLLIGGACGVGYYALAWAATGVWVLLAAQILNAAFHRRGVRARYQLHAGHAAAPGLDGPGTTFTNTFRSARCSPAPCWVCPNSSATGRPSPWPRSCARPVW